MLSPEDFFSLNRFNHEEIFKDIQFVWEVLPKIKHYIKMKIVPIVAPLRESGDLLQRTCVLFQGDVICSGFRIESGDATKGTVKVFRGEEELKGASIIAAGAVLADDLIAIGEGTVVEPGALIKGPTMIGKNTEVRQGAYIRGNCIVGDRCVVGHTTEMKNVIMFDDAKAGHFAYLGDSILGNNVNLGAGTKMANLKFNGSEIILKINDINYKTGLRKFGAILGDDVQMGCNSVSNPGTLIGKSSFIFPNLSVPSGFYPSSNKIIPANGNRLIVELME